MILRYLVTFKVSGKRKLLDHCELTDMISESEINPFSIEGGIEILPVRFGNEVTAEIWKSKNL